MAMSTAIALGGMVKAALRVGVSFPTEAHPLHENEGVELWTQSSAPHGFVLAVDSGQMKNRASTFNKALIYTVFWYLRTFYINVNINICICLCAYNTYNNRYHKSTPTAKP